jgi:protein-S-isoprenylcysteine O-methyltransferase Ste14
MTATQLPSPTVRPATTIAPRADFRRSLLEWGEWGVILALYCWLVARLWAGFWFDGKVINLLLLLSEGLVIGFVLFRRRANQVSRQPAEWLLALAVTCSPMLASPGGESMVPASAAIGLLLFGLVIQLHAKVTLGRSIGMIPANRGLKLGGPYRFVRHPMYAGYLISHVGFLIANPTWWNLAVYGIGNGLQILRLLAEERLLSRDEQYLEYRTRVPYRLIPNVF